MPGKLSVLGIGPGDPELLTIKAVRIIGESDVLCVPKGREEGSSLALSIVKKAVSLEGKEIVEAHFPMRKTKGSAKVQKRKSAEARKTAGLIDDDELDAKWNETAGNILSKLNEGKSVAFLTLGDPTLYSTFYYLYDRLIELEPELNIEIVPGVSSINASAAKAKISLALGNSRIAILPANYLDNLEVVLETFDTVVLMKVNKVWNEVYELLAVMNLAENAVCVSKVGMEDERIYPNIKDIKQEELNYFSMVIVRR